VRSKIKNTNGKRAKRQQSDYRYFFQYQYLKNKSTYEDSGAGQPPYMFKTDSSVNGTYSAELSESPFSATSFCG
jgi:hypothetical protein